MEVKQIVCSASLICYKNCSLSLNKNVYGSFLAPLGVNDSLSLSISLSLSLGKALVFKRSSYSILQLHTSFKNSDVDEKIDLFVCLLFLFPLLLTILECISHQIFSK